MTLVEAKEIARRSSCDPDHITVFSDKPLSEFDKYIRKLPPETQRHLIEKCANVSVKSKRPYLQLDDYYNGDLTADMITAFSRKNVVWMDYDYDDKLGIIKFIWDISPHGRNKFTRNPFVKSNRIAIGYNDLQSCYPELLKEWDVEKNSVSPVGISPYSHKKIWWVCQKGHHWEASVSHRVGGTGCPFCGCNSRGEKKIAEVLNKLGCPFKAQYTFDDCRSPLRDYKMAFDFAVFNNGCELPYALIEYDGEQHTIDCSFGAKKMSERNRSAEIRKRDRTKNAYCLKNGYRLIRISYTEFNDIENILFRELTNVCEQEPA